MDNDNSLGMGLLDLGTCFTFLDKCSDSEIGYGAFVITLINADYNKIRSAITDTIHKYFDKGIKSDDIEEFCISLIHRIDFNISYASKGYLGTEASNMVAQLLTLEIMNKLEAEHLKVTDVEKFIPDIFSDLQFRNDIINILKRNSDDLSPIMQKTGIFEIDSTLINMEVPAYTLNSVSDYILLDLKMYIERSDKTVKECEHCGRLFLPTRKSDKYCRLPNWSRKTCSEIMHISPNDEFVKIRNKARDKQHKQIVYYDDKGKYEHDFLYNLYNNWSDECKKKYREYRQRNDLDGFKTWIESTKFSAGRLKEIWKQHQNSDK